MDSVTLAILEDDSVLVKVLRAYFGQQPDIRLVLVANCVEELLAEFDEGLVPRVLLLDIGLPGLSGTEVLPLLKDKYPALEVIMFTAYEDVEHVYQALCCGATGYLTKGTSLDQLKAGVLEVASGGAPMSRGVGRKVLGHFRPTHHPPGPADPARAAGTPGHHRWAQRQANLHPPGLVHPHRPHPRQARVPQNAGQQPNPAPQPTPARTCLTLEKPLAPHVVGGFPKRFT